MPTNATMSSAAEAVPSEGTSDRKAAKGRRRRAAAEQRRIEQQRWGKYLDEDKDDDYAVVIAPIPPGSRRRARRRNDRESLHTSFDHALEEDLDPDLALSLALALSLSSTTATDPPAPIAPIGTTLADMTYESLVQLENVTCVASAAMIESLPVCDFVKEQAGVSEVCVICQGEYDHGDLQVKLPCSHAFHQACGAEWLRKYSKLCPVCKHDITEIVSEVSEVPEASL